MLIGSILLIVVISYYSYISHYKNKVAKNLDELLQMEAIILDVRTEVEYKHAHMEGSINIPLGSLNSKHESLGKNKTIITCCSHGIRSVRAIKKLQNNGFTNVYNGGSWTHLKKMIK